MNQNQGIPLQWLCIHSRYIISNRISFPLIIVVLPCHPAMISSGIVDIFKFIKFPDDIPIVINFNQIHAILHTIIRMAVSAQPHHIAARQKLRRHGVHIPSAHLIAVHIKQQNTVIDQGYDRVPVPAFLRIVYGYSVWKNERLSHIAFLHSMVLRCLFTILFYQFTMFKHRTGQGSIHMQQLVQQGLSGDILTNDCIIIL